MALPMPLLAPVTTAIWFFKLSMIGVAASAGSFTVD